MHKLDALDLKILDLYQRDTTAPARRIGATVGLSAAAVQRRLKRLRASGVIVAEVARVAPEHVGYKLTCLVGVRLVTEGKSQNARFTRRVSAHAQVQQCYSVTGDVDFMLVVLARDIADFDAFTQDMLYGDANVRSFTTYVCLQAVKVGLGTPIDPTIADA